MKSLKRIMLFLLAIAILVTIPISVNAATPNNTTTTKPSTSQPVWCWEGGSKHVISVGIGWYSSYNAAKQAGMEKIGNGSGSWEVQECDCGKFTVYVKIDDIPTSHTHTWDNGTVTTPATCTTKGVITYNCTGCDETLIGSIPETGHNYNKNVVAPTCNDNGYTKYVCVNCNDAYVSDYISALGHNYKYVANNNGTHQKVCNNCNQITSENCTKVKDGDFEVCTLCNARYEITKPTEPSKPHTHTWDNGTVTTPATCTKKGIVTYHCSGCDETRLENIDELGHSYKYVPNNDGTHKKVCNNCDFVEVENCSKVKDGNYEVCSSCNAKYEITKPTEPTKPTNPSEPSTEPTSPTEPTTNEKPSTTLKDEEKATEPSTEPTAKSDKEETTTTSVASTEKTTSDTKSPETGNDINPFGIALVSSGVVVSIALMIVMCKARKKETE